MVGRSARAGGQTGASGDRLLSVVTRATDIALPPARTGAGALDLVIGWRVQGRGIPAVHLPAGHDTGTAGLGLPFTHKSAWPGEFIAEAIAFAHVLEVRIPQPHQLVTRRGILAPCQVAADDGDQLDVVSQTRGRVEFFFAA